MDLETFAWRWALFAIVLAAAIALFAFGSIGGGDAKLAAATVLWLGWEHTLSYLFLASMIGAVLTITMLQLRGNIVPARVVNVEWIARLYRADSGIPYGIALGAAAIMIYPETRWMETVLNLALLGG